MVDKCIQNTNCGCSQTEEEVRVSAVSDYRHNKPAPRDNDYDILHHADIQLARANWNNVNGGDVHTVVTACSINRPTGTFGWSPARMGILFSYTSRPPVETLAHEVGHFVDYKGDYPGDPFHSKDSENLMRKSSTGKEPTVVDCQWCQRVLALAH